MSQDIVDLELVEIEPKEETDLVIVELDQAKVQLAQMAALGNSVTSIAGCLSRSEAWVRQHKKDPEVRALIGELQRESIEQAKLAITHGANTAAKTMCDLLSNPNPGVQLSAAKDILDRLGLKAVERKEITTNVNIHMDPEERRKQLFERIRRLEGDDC